jgi:uncharacterized protein YktA (UPF0223 family)
VNQPRGVLPKQFIAVNQEIIMLRREFLLAGLVTQTLFAGCSRNSDLEERYRAYKPIVVSNASSEQVSLLITAKQQVGDSEPSTVFEEQVQLTSSESIKYEKAIRLPNYLATFDIIAAISNGNEERKTFEQFEDGSRIKVIIESESSVEIIEE